MRFLTYHKLRHLFPLVWRDGRPISLLSFWGFTRVSSSLNNVSTIETSADIIASYATSYTWTLLATTCDLRVLLWFLCFFIQLSTYSLSSDPFYHYNFIGTGMYFCNNIVTSTQAGTRVVHFVAQAFTRNTENF